LDVFDILSVNYKYNIPSIKKLDKKVSEDNVLKGKKAISL